MVSLNWCCKQKSGIQLVEPNDNLAVSYIKMADDALGTMERERKYNSIFSLSACYYSMYYSLYAVLMKIGIKCEIHSCTLAVMEQLLNGFYSEQDLKVIKKAFDVRNNSQYYANSIIPKEDIDFVIVNAPLFVSKSREVIAKINQTDVNKVREILKKEIL